MATNDKTLCDLDKLADYKVASDDCDVRECDGNFIWRIWLFKLQPC